MEQGPVSTHWPGPIYFGIPNSNLSKLLKKFASREMLPGKEGDVSLRIVGGTGHEAAVETTLVKKAAESCAVPLWNFGHSHFCIDLYDKGL